MTLLLMWAALAWGGIECPTNSRSFENPDMDAWKTDIAKRDHEGWRAQWEMGLWQDWPELKRMGWVFPLSEKVECGKPSTIGAVGVQRVDVSPPGPKDYLVTMDWDLCGGDGHPQVHPSYAAILVPTAIGKWCRVDLYEVQAQKKDPPGALGAVELVSLTHETRKTLKITRQETVLFNRQTDGFKRTVSFVDTKGVDLVKHLELTTNFHGRTPSGPRLAFTATAEIEGSDVVYTKRAGCTEPDQMNHPVDPATCTGEPEVTRYIRQAGEYVPVR